VNKESKIPDECANGLISSDRQSLWPPKVSKD